MFSNFTGRQGVSIFNRRRRPRQAVYASPQSQEVESLTRDEEMDDQLVNMGQDFEGGRNSYGFPSYGHQPPPGDFEKTIAKTRPLPQTRQIPLQKHPNNHLNSENMQLRQERCDEQQIMANRGRYPGSQKPTNREFHFNKSCLSQPQGHRPTTQSSQAQGQYSWSNQSPFKCPTAEPSVARQPLDIEQTHSLHGNDKQQKKIKIDKPAADTAAGKSGFTLKSVDKTMKFVTSNIQGVRKWSEHRDTVPLIFEIFATLDSVPTSNNNGTAKFFNLKDPTGSIRAVYWEMDQKLPRMARGQIYRLTGALDRKNGHFQCYTIRQALFEEQRLAPKQISICDNALTKILAMVSEA